MEFLIVLAILSTVVLVVLWPVMRPAGGRTAPGPDSESAAAELRAERDAKYREIRDADLDHRTGKLSDADYEALDGGLRAEAVEIMHALERVGQGPDRPRAAPPA